MTPEDVYTRMRYVGEIDATITTIAVERNKIVRSNNLNNDQKRQLEKCLDVTIAVLKRALVGYADEALNMWKEHGLQSNS